jgi:hypothetical protein
MFGIIRMIEYYQQDGLPLAEHDLEDLRIASLRITNIRNRDRGDTELPIDGTLSFDEAGLRTRKDR